jgi:hypothetical protein
MAPYPRRNKPADQDDTGTQPSELQMRLANAEHENRRLRAEVQSIARTVRAAAILRPHALNEENKDSNA